MNSGGSRLPRHDSGDQTRFVARRPDPHHQLREKPEAEALTTHNDEQDSQQEQRAIADGAYTAEPQDGHVRADGHTPSRHNGPDRREEVRWPGVEPRQECHGQEVREAMEVMISSLRAA